MTATQDFLDTAHVCAVSQGVHGGVEEPDHPNAKARRDSQNGGGVGVSNQAGPIHRSKATRHPGLPPNSPQPRTVPTATSGAAAAPRFPDTLGRHDSQTSPGVGDQATEPAQKVNDSHRLFGGFGTKQPTPPNAATESQRSFGGVGPNVPPPPNHDAESHMPVGGGGPILRDPTLALAADVVDDLERVKIANQNRLRTLTAQDEHGHGMSIEHPDVKRLAALVKALEDAEYQATLNLARVMRHHPLGEWVKASKGVGEKQAARLLAAIGDPYWNDLHGRPRRLRELYAFCGMNVVGTSAHCGDENHGTTGAGAAPTKQRGERVTWNPDARMRLWLIASKCVMVGHGGPYRTIYDEGRLKYADALHAEECKRCGPKGQPAQPGTPLSASHQHARAVRLIAKQILRDLWTAAKTIHEGETK